MPAPLDVSVRWTLSGYIDSHVDPGSRKLVRVGEADELLNARRAAAAKVFNNGCAKLRPGKGVEANHANAKVDLVLVDGGHLVVGQGAAPGILVGVGDFAQHDDAAIAARVDAGVEGRQVGAVLGDNDALIGNPVGEETGADDTSTVLVAGEDEDRALDSLGPRSRSRNSDIGRGGG